MVARACEYLLLNTKKCLLRLLYQPISVKSGFAAKVKNSKSFNCLSVL